MNAQHQRFLLLVRVLFVLILLGGMFIPKNTAAAAGEAQVWIDPATSTGRIGDTITIKVSVSGVTNLYGADLMLQFDPSAFEVQDENPGQVGVQVATSDWLVPGYTQFNYVDNDAGTIRFAVTGTEAVSGAGTLFTFHLRTKKAVISSPISFGHLAYMYPILCQPNGTPISITTADGAVTIQNPVDLSISKSDGLTEIEAGEALSYAIVVTNTGTTPVTGAAVSDSMPAALQSVSWTCAASSGASCAAAGTGDIADTVNLPAAGSVTYTVNATVAETFTGTLTNTASVTLPAELVDTYPSDNTASDTTSVLKPSADLAVTKTDGLVEIEAGKPLIYTITVTNNGPKAVVGATVSDNMPVSLENVTWTCAGTGGASCTASGTGSIADTVNLPVSGVVTYTVSATVKTSFVGDMTNTASAAVPNSMRDLDLANNTASDTTKVQPTIPVTGDDIFIYIPIIQKP